MNGSPDRLIETRLGSYKIVEAIGQGGMARVYKGYHEDLDRYAAIKVITWGLVEDEDFTMRFRREAQAIASLRHPNIVTIYDFGKYEHGYYLVMEYIDGPDLDSLIARAEPIPPAVIQQIIHDIAGALDYAHSNDVIHRDVKPSNIMLTKEGQAILTDFGLVMLPNRMGNTTLGNAFGTPYYMAPEQATSSAAAVPASDIYSLGVILFELITGTPPYVADSPLGVALKHVGDPVPDVQDFAPDTPSGVKAVIEKAMAKDPADRFDNALEMAETLAQVWDEVEIQPLKSGPLMPAHILPPLNNPERALAPHPGPVDSTATPPEPAPSQDRPTPARLWWGALAVVLLLVLSLGVWFNLGRTGDANIAAAVVPSDTPSPAPATATPQATPDSSAGTADQPPTATPDQALTATPTPRPTETPAPPPTATASATATPSPSATPSPTFTATASPTAAPPPSPTDTPTTSELLESLRGKILFKTDRSGRVEIYQMNADGADQKPLGVDFAYLYNEAVRWEAFSADRTETIVVRGEGQVDLWRVNIADGFELRVTSEPAPDYDPVWSPLPNDNRIIFVSERTGRGDLYLLDLDGSRIERLTRNESDFDKHPSWSPDGRRVVYWSDQGWNGNRQIWMIDLETREAISLSNNPFRDWDPVWVK